MYSRWRCRRRWSDLWWMQELPHSWDMFRLSITGRASQRPCTSLQCLHLNKRKAPLNGFEMTEWLSGWMVELLDCCFLSFYWCSTSTLHCYSCRWVRTKPVHCWISIAFRRVVCMFLCRSGSMKLYHHAIWIIQFIQSVVIRIHHRFFLFIVSNCAVELDRINPIFSKQLHYSLSAIILICNSF